MNTHTTAAITASLLAVTLTACGSSDDKPAAPTSATTAAQSPTTPAAPADDTSALEKAVTAYTAAYFAPDPDTAHGLLSARCKTKMPKATLSGVLAQAATDYGPDHPATNVQAQVSGDLARVTYKVKGLPKFDQQAQPWALENGQWRYDAC